jgi:phospholipid/cholesterol/gamma-HCH transport system substrate-binding protein
MNREIKVGLTVIVAMLCFGGLVVFLGKMHFSKPGYKVEVDYNFVDSVKKDAPVLYGGGVEIGLVHNITVAQGLVRVTLHIFEQYQIPPDSIFTIHTSGILGEKYVQIAAGNLASGVVAGGAVVRGMDPGSLDRTLQRVEAMTDFLQPLLEQEEFRRDFSRIFKNLGNMTDELSSLVDRSSPDIRATVTNLKTLVAELQDVTGDAKKLIAEAREVTTPENRRNISAGLASLRVSLDKLEKALTAMENQKGALGALVYDEETAQNLRDVLRDVKRHPWKLLWKK